jgi:maleate cis-trans isomerase
MAAHPEADTLLLPCPHWDVVEIIQPLEDAFGINVVSNFQATLWHALATLGITDPIPGYGRLLRKFPCPRL